MYLLCCCHYFLSEAEFRFQHPDRGVLVLTVLSHTSLPKSDIFVETLTVTQSGKAKLPTLQRQDFVPHYSSNVTLVAFHGRFPQSPNVVPALVSHSKPYWDQQLRLWGESAWFALITFCTTTSSLLASRKILPLSALVCVGQPRRDTNLRRAAMQAGVFMLVTASICSALIAKQTKSDEKAFSRFCDSFLYKEMVLQNLSPRFEILSMEVRLFFAAGRQLEGKMVSLWAYCTRHKRQLFFSPSLDNWESNI